MSEPNEINALLNDFQKGNESAFEEIFARFEPLLHSMISGFSETTVLRETDKEDLLQEAIIALYKAATRFKTDQGGVTFGLYAKICIKNRLISAKRHLERQKRKKAAVTKQRKPSFFFNQNTDKTNYEYLLRIAEEHLSDYENKVLKMYLSGMRYKEIAEKLHCSVKSVDNAIHRARSKVRRIAGTLDQNIGF